MTLKTILLLVVLLLISSCGSDETGTDATQTDTSGTVENSQDSTQNTVGLRYYPGKGFAMKIPASWNLVTDNKSIIPTPTTGNLELAVTSTETKGGFANNLIVLSQFLDEYTTSKDYSIVNNVGAENEYVNYTKISGKDFTFSDGEKSMLYVFEAKYSESTPVLKFIQTAYVCNNNNAFFLTIAIPTDITNTSKYEQMLQTFECK